MKNYFIFLAVVSFLSCDPVDVSSLSSQMCTFFPPNGGNAAHLDKKEREILQQCHENRLMDKNEISRHIIGEWRLVGYAVGLASGSGINDFTQPCAYITINSDSLHFRFESSYYTTNSTYSWEIEKLSENDEYPNLKVSPSNGFLRFFVFCDQYMYQDNTALDGRMFLYKKWR